MRRGTCIDQRTSRVLPRNAISVAVAAGCLGLGACSASVATAETQVSLPALPAQNGLTEAEVGAVVARLASAQARARAEGPLPFRLSCNDEAPGPACENDGRAALAALPLERIAAVAPIYNTSCLRVMFEYPGDRCPPSVAGQPRSIDAYLITLPYAAGGYTWRVGLAPGEGIEEVRLRRGTVVFH